VSIELFSLVVTAEALLANVCSTSAISLQLGPVDPKFQVEGVAPPTILLLRNLGKCLYFVWYKNLNISFFHFVTIHAFDRRTDGESQHFFSEPLRMSNVTINHTLLKTRFFWSTLLSHTAWV